MSAAPFPRFNRDARLVFLLLAFLYGYFVQDPEYNGNSRLDLVYAVVHEGRLTIDSYHLQRETFTGDKSIKDGHYYSDKAVGSSLLGVLVYAPIYGLLRLAGLSLGPVSTRYVLTFLVIGLPSALAGSLMYALSRWLGRDRLVSFAVTASVALGTICWPFGSVYFSHQLAGSMLFIAFFLSLRLRLAPRQHGVPAAAAFGSLLGLSLITEFPSALIVVPLSLHYRQALARLEPAGRRRALTAAASAAIVPILILFAYNAACFGSPLASAYSYHYNLFYRAQMSRGLMGIGAPSLRVLYDLLLLPATGLLWYSPALLFAVSGLRRLWNAGRLHTELLLCSWALASFLLMASGYYMWWGGHAIGSRHVIPALPFLAVPLAGISRRSLPVFAALTAIGIGQMVLALASTPLVPDDALKVPGQPGLFDYSPFYDWCLPALRAGRWAPNLGSALLDLSGWASLAPLVLVLAAAACAAWHWRGDADADPYRSQPG